MFNVTILKLKDIIRAIFMIIVAIILIIGISKIFSLIKENNKKETVEKIEINEEQAKDEKILFGSLLSCLDKTIPVSSVINEENDDIKESDNIVSKNYLEEFLKTEISSIKEIENMEYDEIKEALVENNDNEEIKKENNTSINIETNSTIELAKVSDIKSEVVTENPISESYNVQYGNVKIKNQTSFELTDEMMNPDITIDNKNVIIFHTHSCESYTSSEKYQYISTGNFRTTDLNYSVTRVGTELENYLAKYNFNVIHNTDYHDYPAYNGSYGRSLETVENILKETNADIIFDVHRDAIGSREDYAPTVKIGDDYAAQIMFVIGTNDGGMWHPNWNQNLKFAIKVQQKAEEMYPGLFKPIMLTPYRYNQHTSKYASIIEVGATGNTLDQCLTSMKYLSSVLNEVTK